jgi:hypothetical protein
LFLNERCNKSKQARIFPVSCRIAASRRYGYDYQGYGYDYQGYGYDYAATAPLYDYATPAYGYGAVAPATAGTTIVIVTPGAPAYTAPPVASGYYNYAPGYWGGYRGWRAGW